VLPSRECSALTSVTSLSSLCSISPTPASPVQSQARSEGCVASSSLILAAMLCLWHPSHFRKPHEAPNSRPRVQPAVWSDSDRAAGPAQPWQHQSPPEWSHRPNSGSSIQQHTFANLSEHRQQQPFRADTWLHRFLTSAPIPEPASEQSYGVALPGIYNIIFLHWVLLL
jgi:hypothetical protein